MELVTSPKRELGKIIRTYRKRLRWTQEYLAEVVNVSARQISRIENGVHFPSVQLMFALGETLGINLDELKKYF